ncbi:PREDICTED: PI-PLC X domain-containing protein 3 isoform X3 [Papilio polytes]|uniref:PI-PLC X domain-containing protein 3 isoform X3 n=1 Tax=Papilio polytes TaxID=76194 RepID=UPI000676A4AE|nr:PREDICTED: PI-PLC X domain-containing protein 3 isoform X3 [Papilio polytes]
MRLGLLLAAWASIMCEDGSAQNLNLENWMRDLPEQLKNVPIIYLAIPGSHDSMTYGITESSGIAPDAEPIVKKLYPLFRGTILRWTITQAVDTSQQLLIGIRYFDLRIATKTGNDKFYFTHGVYADEITTALQQVKNFVDTHPGEVVILDCQHFYGFTANDHQRLMGLLLHLYGQQLVPRKIDLQSITLNSLARLRQQVVIVYRHQSVYSTDQFWQPQMLPSPWPQQERVAGLLAFLQRVRRHPGMGWISTLREKCAIPVKDEVLPKLLKDFFPGPPPHVTDSQNLQSQAPVNVVIADFVEMDDAIFSKTIIQLNMKLLKTIESPYTNYG